MSNRGSIEYGTGGGSMEAYRSLSRATGVPLERVIAHARANTLAAIIPETRSRGRGPGRGADPLVRIEWLYRRRVLSLLSDRAAAIGG